MSIENADAEYIRSVARRARLASGALRSITTRRKNHVLETLADLIQKNGQEIKNENAKDLENAHKENLSPSLTDRLTISDKVLGGMVKSIEEISMLTDPVGQVIEGKTLPNGIQLEKVRVPLGVLAVIFESRPNVTVDVASLGLKSSNCVILRGGKEAIHSNKMLAALFRKALSAHTLPSDTVQLIEKTDRSLIPILVKCDKDIDLVVPRGGEALIKYVCENSSIPVVKHDKGVVHIFIEKTADYNKAQSIVLNSKTQRPGVCNAAETLVIEKSWPHSGKLLEELSRAGVRMHADVYSRDFFTANSTGVKINLIDPRLYHTEYLSMDISLKAVDTPEEALSHISEYSSGHSEAIISNDYSQIDSFLSGLDSAALFVNCSTRFHDGGEFGYGAEVGIATGKLHVRGPMGLTDLTTMKYIARGNGQIRS